MSAMKYFGTVDGEVFRQEGKVIYRLSNGVWEERRLDGYKIELETIKKTEIKSWALKKSMTLFKEFVVESKPEHFNKENIYYDAGDETAPFISEGFLYPLLGKEDARSVLYYIRKLDSVIGSL